MRKSVDTTVSSPLNVPKKSPEYRRGPKVNLAKGALSYAHDFYCPCFYIHCYVGQLRRVHASKPQMEVEPVQATTISGTKTKTMVKAFDQLAVKGALYQYHSKTKMYGVWFFRTWYGLVVPTCRNFLPILKITTIEAGFHLGL